MFDFQLLIDQHRGDIRRLRERLERVEADLRRAPGPLQRTTADHESGLLRVRIEELEKAVEDLSRRRRGIA